MTRLVVLSGGLDSTTVLAHVLDQHEQVAAVGFDYGQQHARELSSAASIAAHYGVPYQRVSLQGLFHGSSLLADDPTAIPRADYDADSMASTVVNGRNLLFASAAVAVAEPGDTIWFGVHGGDHHLYPDCRPEFWNMLTVLTHAAYETLLRTPFLLWSKADIAAHAASLNAPIALTWSCYEGGEQHCGECGTCRERREAFRLAGVDDPTVYGS